MNHPADTFSLATDTLLLVMIYFFNELGFLVFLFSLINQSLMKIYLLQFCIGLMTLPSNQICLRFLFYSCELVSLFLEINCSTELCILTVLEQSFFVVLLDLFQCNRLVNFSILAKSFTAVFH